MTPTLHLPIKKITVALAAIALYLCVQSIIAIRIQYGMGTHNTYFMYNFSDFVDVDAEGNLPTWFSTVLLLSSAVLLAMITTAKKYHGDRYVGHWRGLSFIFLYLSIDECAQIHETFSTPLGDVIGSHGFLYFTWVVAGAVFVLIVGVFYAKFLWHLPLPTRLLFMLAGGMYVLAVIGLDAFGGNMWYVRGGTSFNYSIETTIEEFIEMQSIILFIYILMTYLKTYASEFQISFQQRAAGES